MTLAEDVRAVRKPMTSPQARFLGALRRSNLVQKVGHEGTTLVVYTTRARYLVEPGGRYRKTPLQREEAA